MALSPRTHRRFEEAAQMKFQAILHKGSWGHCAECADMNGKVWNVNKKTREICPVEGEEYKDGSFCVISKG